ncbi:MAG TPA: vWA domain-containing protein [Kofleriaceae bacterium]|nr:vWA domain-containing protein [Kofleriaceae bacterium]
MGAVLLFAACGGNKAAESLCADQVPPPAACNTPCDPVSGADQCPLGYHCSADGKCDTQCTPTGNECGASNTCTNDGFCQPGDNNGPPPIDAECPAVHFTASKVTPSVQLLLDRSGSMLEDFNGNDNGLGNSKFTAEDKALVDPTGVVTQLQSSVYFGVMMYPSNVCPGTVQTPRALMNAGAIASFIQSNVPASTGNTPTPQAIDSAVQDFVANKPPAGSPPIIVLATDGLPNDCSGKNGNLAKQQSITAAANAFSKGIKLFVLVVGNQFDDTFKRALANAGQGVQPGQPDAKAYSATNATQLTQAFQEIIGGVVSCDLKLNGHVDPGNAQTGSVSLNGANLIFGTDWNVDADGTTLHLLGKACDTLKGSTDPKVDATFSCGAVLL